ncbi:hypothetical protein EBR21_08155 [bacterium]|nr:hypothetical protein [bacterium]
MRRERWRVDVAELRQIVEMFIQESDETLAQFEQCFLELEKSGPDSRVIERLCRMSRNLKGSAAALGFDEIANFTSHLEKFLLALKDEKQVIPTEIISLLLSARDFLAAGIKALRSGKKSTETGEDILEAMKNVRRKKPDFESINLPRPAEAGDIWFVGDDLKAVLFEMPELPQPTLPETSQESEAAPAISITTALGDPTAGFTSIDPKLAAIQAEILRLTMLAAQVNLNTVQAASAFESQSTAHAKKSEPAQVAEHIPGEELVPDEANRITDENKNEDSESVDAGPTIEKTHNGSDSKPKNQEIGAAPEAKTADPENNFSASNANTNTSPAPAWPTSGEFLETSHPHPEVDALLPAALLSGLGTADNQVKIGLDRIDRLVNFVGELVILQSSIEEHRKAVDHPQLQKSFSQLAKVVREVQEIATGLRMVKIKPTYLKIQRFARDYSCEINKNVQVDFWGVEVELDKTLLDLITEPLIELVKYSLKFGIEEVDVRSRTGKPAQAKIEVSTKKLAHSIVIEVRDDGRGIDLELMRKNAVERGLLAPIREDLRRQTACLDFSSGIFSTRHDRLWSAVFDRYESNRHTVRIPARKHPIGVDKRARKLFSGDFAGVYLDCGWLCDQIGT